MLQKRRMSSKIKLKYWFPLILLFVSCAQVTLEDSPGANDRTYAQSDWDIDVTVVLPDIGKDLHVHRYAFFPDGSESDGEIRVVEPGSQYRFSWSGCDWAYVELRFHVRDCTGMYRCGIEHVIPSSCSSIRVRVSPTDNVRFFDVSVDELYDTDICVSAP
jgi:hypothetical protein